jgi:SAM-dependent methyltransferase
MAEKPPGGGEEARPDREAMEQAQFGFLVSELIHVAAKLGNADALARGAEDGASLALRLDCDADALMRFMRALAAHGFLAEEAGIFRLTPLGSLLGDGAGGSRAAAIYWGEPWIWNVWSNLLFSVRTGRSAFENLHGATFFDYLSGNAGAARAFDDFMAESPTRRHSAVAAAYDFSRVATVIDIGSGTGAMLAGILAKYPGVFGIAFDRPELAREFHATMSTRGLSERSAFIAGDFFAAVPEGGECYVLSHVIHDWKDDQALSILRNCRRVMASGQKLLLVEQIVDASKPSRHVVNIDMAMLALLGGRERNAMEYRGLLAASGLQIVNITTTDSPFSIIESVAG